MNAKGRTNLALANDAPGKPWSWFECVIISVPAEVKTARGRNKLTVFEIGHLCVLPSGWTALRDSHNNMMRRTPIKKEP